jgi:NADP-dependent 3-hydroxy acid dehydrogenase YdfG
VNAISIGVPGGELADAPPDAMAPYLSDLVPGVFNVVRVGARVLREQASGTLVQITGGSSRRGMSGRGPWAAAAFATRPLVQCAALELREHASTRAPDRRRHDRGREDPGVARGQAPEASTTEADVAAAVRYLAAQSPRGWTHELQITPRLDRWVP